MCCVRGGTVFKRVVCYAVAVAGSFLLCAGGADVKMISAAPTALHADQPDGAGHFFNRRRGHLSNKVSRSGGCKHMVLK